MRTLCDLLIKRQSHISAILKGDPEGHKGTLSASLSIYLEHVSYWQAATLRTLVSDTNHCVFLQLLNPKPQRSFETWLQSISHSFSTAPTFLAQWNHFGADTLQKAVLQRDVLVENFLVVNGKNNQSVPFPFFF